MTINTTETQVEAALRRNFGNITYAAMELGITRTAVSMRVRGSERLQAAKAEIEETILDLSEAGMVQGLIERDGPMIRYHLDRKGRARGYAPRQELTGADGAALVSAVAPVVQLDEMPDDERGLLRELLQRQQLRLSGQATD